MSFITERQTLRKMITDTVFYFRHLPPGGFVNKIRAYFIFMKVCWGRKVEYSA